MQAYEYLSGFSNGADRDMCEGLMNEVYGLFLYCDRLSEFDRDIVSQGLITAIMPLGSISCTYIAL